MAKKILVADDETDIIEVIEMLLSSEGYEVIKAHDGLEALEVVRNVIPDLIILDIMMPEIDGVEVCKRMRMMEKIIIESVAILVCLLDKQSAAEQWQNLKAHKGLLQQRWIKSV